MSHRTLSDSSHRPATPARTPRPSSARPGRADGAPSTSPAPATSAPAPTSGRPGSSGASVRRKRTSTITAVAPSAQKAGMMWQRPVSPSSTAASARYRPVSRPLNTTPRYSSRQAQRDRERELAGQRRGDVAAVDREAPVEEERQRSTPPAPPASGSGCPPCARTRRPQTAASTTPLTVTSLNATPYGRPTSARRDTGDHERGPMRTAPIAPPGRGRTEGDDPDERRDQGGPAVEPGVEQHDQQRREHHVELVRGEAGVPVARPARELAVGQQVVAQVGGAPHVGAHVAAGRRGVREQQVGLQVPEHERDARHHAPRRRRSCAACAVGRPGPRRRARSRPGRRRPRCRAAPEARTARGGGRRVESGRRGRRASSTGSSTGVGRVAPRSVEDQEDRRSPC